MNWLHYLAEANIYLGVFYLAYCLLLARNTHYQLSRAYLVLSCVFSFLLPVLQVSALKHAKTPEPVIAHTYALQAVINVPEPATQPVVVNKAPVTEQHFTLSDGLWYGYLTSVAVLLCAFFVKLFVLFRLAAGRQSVRKNRHRLIELPDTEVAFSFFNYLFIGRNMSQADTVIRHELVHIRQKHSADIIFLELLKIVSWFNPLIYMLQNSLKAVHEYIADEQTAAYETDTLSYSSFLLTSAYGAGASSITHSFFNYNLLKKRIIMLNQQRSGNLARLKYLVAIPICTALLCASTLVFAKTYGWVDLAPASVKSANSSATVNKTAKRKRLKITQNGVTTISDQLAVDQNNKKVVYTPATLTAASTSSLLKNQKIKVEVVDDSTRLVTMDGKLMLPVVNVDGYYLLDHYLHNNIHYSSAKNEKGGLVEIGFSLDNNRHITDAKVIRSGGAKLDALALNSFNAYKGTVNDDAGKSYKIGIYFFTNDYSIFKTDSLQKDPEFAGELIITNYKYPINLTSKGYEYEESNLGFPADGGGMKYARVIIFDKNGDAYVFLKNKVTADDVKMLKDKFGYTFPSSSYNALQTMHPKNADNKRLAYIFGVSSYLDAPYSDHFYSYMVNKMAYPQTEEKTLTGGVVVLNFDLDNNGSIGNVSVTQSCGKDFDDAALNAVQSYKPVIKDSAGKHSIAILFCVAEKKYRPVVPENVKSAGYVGELAISDVKSPFPIGTDK